MSNFIEDLWYGNVNPHEQFLSKSPDFKSQLSTVCKDRDDLNDSLTDDQKVLFEKYEKSINEMESVELIEAFKYGLSIGIRLLYEVESNQLY